MFTLLRSHAQPSWVRNDRNLIGGASWVTWSRMSELDFTDKREKMAVNCESIKMLLLFVQCADKPWRSPRTLPTEIKMD